MDLRYLLGRNHILQVTNYMLMYSRSGNGNRQETFIFPELEKRPPIIRPSGGKLNIHFHFQTSTTFLALCHYYVG